MANPYAQIHTTPLTQVDTSGPKEILGTLRNEKGKTYKYVEVKNSGGTQALAAGDAVCYLAAASDGTRVVTRPAEADAAPVAAGVLQAAVAGVSGNSYYCWIQTKGPATLNQNAAGTPAAGDEVVAGSTAGQLTRRLYAGTTPNIVANGAKAGNMVNTTNKAVLDCTAGDN